LSRSLLISAARGDTPADLVLTGAGIVNVFTGEIGQGNVAIFEGRIVGIGDYTDAKEMIDLKGKYLAPGLIDGHVHLESSMLDAGQYARAVVSRGTTSIVTDLHEIANVAGLEGIRYILKAVKKLPLDLFLMAPSCVPATHLETAGANIDESVLRKILRMRECIGLGEVMNYPGVIFGDDTILGKVELYRQKITDGHAPGVSGKELNAYTAAGICSDHESVTFEEAREKLERGMYIMIREGSSEKNLEALLPLVTDKTYKRCMFVVDDRSCVDILNDGDIDAVVRKAISLGLDPIRAVQLASINTAEYFRLNEIGAIAPGYRANLIVLNDLSTFDIESVYYEGKRIASDGKPLFTARKKANRGITDTMNIKPFGIEALELRIRGDTAHVVEIVPGQIITKNTVMQVRTEDGLVSPDTDRDILKLVVVERHRGTGNIGVGLVNGFGLKSGALASSVAHDSHNIIAVGTNDRDIYAAVREIERLKGGIVAVNEGKVLASPLPVAGILSDEPMETVVSKLDKLEKAAAQLGSGLSSPFSTLSFMALPVIPELRLTDMGLVDVIQFKFIEIS
jgi:adenine deaminase